MIVYLIILFIIVIPGLPLLNILIGKFSDVGNSRKTVVVSHRGAGGLAPENTLDAIDTGLKYHADFLEIDIRQTLDYKIVVIHDKSVDRTTNGKGLVHCLNYADLEKLNASVSFPHYVTATKIPLLSQVLNKIRNTGSRLLIEIKDPGLYPGLVKRLADIIRETNTEKNIMIFSFHQAVLTEVQQQLPGVPTGIFYVGVEKTRDSLHVDYVSPNWITLLYFPFLVKKLHNKGYKILVWTVDSSVIMRYLISKNVDGIISNRPDKLNKSLLNLI